MSIRLRRRNAENKTRKTIHVSGNLISGFDIETKYEPSIEELEQKKLSCWDAYKYVVLSLFWAFLGLLYLDYFRFHLLEHLFEGYVDQNYPEIISNFNVEIYYVKVTCCIFWFIAAFTVHYCNWNLSSRRALYHKCEDIKKRHSAILESVSDSNRLNRDFKAKRRKLLEIFRSLSHTKGLLQGTAATLKIRIKNVEEVKKVMIEQLHGMIRILNDRMDLADESRNIRGLQIEEDYALLCEDWIRRSRECYEEINSNIEPKLGNKDVQKQHNMDLQKLLIKRIPALHTEGVRLAASDFYSAKDRFLNISKFLAIVKEKFENFAAQQVARAQDLIEEKKAKGEAMIKEIKQVLSQAESHSWFDIMSYFVGKTEIPSDIKRATEDIVMTIRSDPPFDSTRSLPTQGSTKSSARSSAAGIASWILGVVSPVLGSRSSNVSSNHRGMNSSGYGSFEHVPQDRDE